MAQTWKRHLVKLEQHAKVKEERSGGVTRVKRELEGGSSSGVRVKKELVEQGPDVEMQELGASSSTSMPVRVLRRLRRPSPEELRMD